MKDVERKKVMEARRKLSSSVALMKVMAGLLALAAAAAGSTAAVASGWHEATLQAERTA